MRGSLRPRALRDLPVRVLTRVGDARRGLHGANDDCYDLPGARARHPRKPADGELKYLPDMLATVEYQF